MIRLLIGFVGGLYVGTKYDVKPQINYLYDFIVKNLTKEK